MPLKIFKFLFYIFQALSKSNSHDSVDDYVLIEEVQKGWEKKSSDKNTHRRFLDINERPLEAQAKWKGEGRFILKKLADVSDIIESIIF